MNIIEIAILIVAILTLLVAAALLVLKVTARGKEGASPTDSDAITELVNATTNELIASAVASIRIMIGESTRENNRSSLDNIERMQTSVDVKLNGLREGNQRAIDKIGDIMKDQIDAIRKEIKESLATMRTEISLSQVAMRNDTTKSLKDMREEISSIMATMRGEEAKRSKDMQDMLEGKVTTMQSQVKSNLDGLRTDNERQLTEMRGIVDEKLQDTLEKRITESFKIINEQLESVHKGLGKMQSLEESVGGLNRILSSVKHRGLLGEVMLDNLLEEILSVRQYGKQVTIKGDNKVDFAVIMPGNGDDTLLLPIDAKFPVSDYERYVEACDGSDKDLIAQLRKELINAIKTQAKSINKKYINPPKTTDFAIIYLPIEGLYAEISREPGLIQDFYQNLNILVCGPTTLSAILSSLKIGFKTLSVQKNSREVWQALAQFQKEFKTFAGLLSKSRKKAGEIVNTLDDGISRSERIANKLNKLTSNEQIGELLEDSSKADVISGAIADNADGDVEVEND